MTVATLGITVDSSQVSKATTELDKLTGAAKRTVPEIDKLSSGAKSLTVSALYAPFWLAISLISAV
jgi:hypothetical protein